ncbi:MAG: PD40 domain-containing protein [Ignavibacteriaceae bacterium]|nr:PD40 domain-containing protein [Ignavibacteriaceae bacterium]
MKKLTLLSFLIAVLLTGCSKEDNTVNPTGDSGITSAKINHYGYDWSKKAGSQNNTDPTFAADGETIAWTPDNSGTNVYGKSLWYRATTEKVYKMTATKLEDVKSIDTTKFGTTNFAANPLRAGDIWATKALDGYAIFLVTKAPIDSAEVAANPNWEIEVMFKYSATTNF